MRVRWEKRGKEGFGSLLDHDGQFYVRNLLVSSPFFRKGSSHHQIDKQNLLGVKQEW